MTVMNYVTVLIVTCFVFVFKFKSGMYDAVLM